MLPWLATTSSPAVFAGIRDTSLSKLVRDEMLALILSGELTAGQRINEPDVAARLSVSRVPVREALRELESSGLVSARKNVGVFVRVLTQKEIADLYELRAVIDGHAGRKAAELPLVPRRALVKRLGELVGTMASHARQGNVQAYYGSNLAFHWAIVEAADNQQMALAYRCLVQQLHVSRLKNLARDPGMHISIVEHREIVAAVKRGDADLCRQLLAAHVGAAHSRLAADATTARGGRLMEARS